MSRVNEMHGRKYRIQQVTREIRCGAKHVHMCKNEAVHM